MTHPNSKLWATAALLLSGGAWAQVYTIQSQSTPYAALAGGTTVTLTARSSFTADDEGFADVPLGFTFPFYGQNYTSVHVDSNGFLLFGSTACDVQPAGDFVCYDGMGMPNAARTNGGFPGVNGPHAVISPWWDDHEGPIGAIRTKQSAGQLEIEYSNWECYGGGCLFTFKVTLTASGLFQLHYGTASGSFASATVGFENQAGTAGAALLPCTTGTTGNCSVASWPTNTLYTIGQPVQPDIVVAQVNIANLVVDGLGNITFNVTPTFQNYGQNPATPAFAWKAYLSLDKTLSVGTDLLVHTAPATVTLTGAGSAGATAMATGAAATVSPPPAGQYYVLVEADTTAQVTEASETNNVGSTLNYFVNGLDLVATSVSGPANSGPGNAIVVNAKWFNQGTSNAGTVSYRVLLSTDAVASTTDFTLFSGSRTVSGGETIDENLNITVPGNVPGGDFYYLLQIDQANAITEASETNNLIASSAKVNMKQADLVNAATDFLDPITGAPTRLGYFGQAARVTVRVDNVGGANAVNFKVGVVVSSDATLSLLSDTIAWEGNVAAVNAGASLPVDLPFTMPLKDKNNLDFPTGDYFIFTIVDSTSAITELNEANNNVAIMGQVSLRAPAPDLTVTLLQAAPTGAVGEVIPVLRSLKNIGNVDSPAVKYRFYASANDIITVDDLPLPIVAGATSSPEGTITLAVGVSDTRTELVRLPASLTPGTYWIGCIVDFSGMVAELEEGNNALRSSPLTLAASSLRVSTQQLPDAIVDRPYSYRLVATGEQGPSSWSLDPSQGTLPVGMTFGTDGLISGTPTASSVTAFTVVVNNNLRDASARLVLRVLPTTTQVEITTSSLPAVVNTPAQRYELPLAAAGGVKPYAWKILAGELPMNLTLSADGVISGFPRPGLLEGNSLVTFEVQDSLGTRAQRQLTVKVVAQGAIIFRNLALTDALVGSDYGQDVAVANADGTPIAGSAKPIVWTKLGELPDGMVFSPAGEVASIEGKALRAGTFSFSLTVEDARGRSDTATFTIRVYPARFTVSADGLPEQLRPGEPVSFRITANTGIPPVFTLYSGQLPPGVVLNPDGTVTGSVATEKSVGAYNFVVEAIDPTGASGLGVFNLEVRAEVVRPPCGCQNTTGLWLWALALLVPALWRRSGAGRTGNRSAARPT